MPQLTVLDKKGTEVEKITLADSVFGIEPNQSVLYDAIVMQQASLRQGTHATKNRSAVRGGGRKPWRQKGTGRARQGSIRSPQWVGGGVAFGPTPRSYSYKLPKKVRRLAIKSALSLKVKENEMIVLNELKMDAPKTKEFVAMLNSLSVDKKTLVIIGEFDEVVARSARNLQHVTLVTAAEVNVLDVVGNDKVIATKNSIEKLEEVLG